MKPTFSIRLLLFLFAISVTVPLVILLVYTLYSAVITKTQNARVSAVGLAQAAANDVTIFLNGVELHLTSIAERSEIRVALQDPLTCSRTLQILQYSLPEASFFVVLDEQGKPICTILANDLTQFPFSAQPWFSAARDGNQVIVTAPQSGLVPDRNILLLAYPLQAPGETKQGIVLAGVDPAQLQTVLTHQQLNPEEILVLLDGEGTLLALTPDPSQLSGTNLRTAEFVQTALSQIQGNVQTRGLDGTERIFGFTTVPQTGWRVIAGVPTGSAFASAWQYAMINGTLLLIAILLVAAAARWYTKRIERPLNALVEATTAVTQGDLTTRVSVQGPPELAQLAVQFNAMVDAREAFDKALRLANDKYRTLIEQLPAVVYRTLPDKGNRALFVNAVIQDLLGYAPEEWMANPGLWSEHIHPEDRARVAAALAQSSTLNQPLTVEYRLFTRDGRLVWVRDQARALPHHNGQPRMLQGIVFDITSHKLADERMAYLAQLLDQVHDAIIATDAEHKITAWNRAAQEMYGWQATEALGQPLDKIVATEITAQTKTALEETLQAEGACRFEVEQYRKTGEPLFVESTTMMLRNHAQEITGYVSVNRDMTAHQHAEQKLERRTAHAEALAHTAAALNARLEFDAVVRAIASETARALKVPLAFVFLYKENSNSFRLAAAFGLSESCTAALMEIPYVYPIALDSPPTLYSRNWASLAMWSNAGRGEMPRLTGALTVPLRHKDEWVGLVSAATTDQTRPFTTEDSELLAGLADQAALAVANARLFDQVRAGRQRLQTLSRRLVEVQETERHAIARELHDEIGQSLTGLSLVLEMAARALPHGVNVNLAEAQSIVNQIMKQVRNLSLELRPAMLDDLGLVPALTWQVQRYSTQTGIHVDLKLMGLEGKRFPTAVETAAYRIVQEALTNIARYARVQHAKVRVWTEDHTLGLMIEDAGIGFEADAALSSNQSSGLIGMRERAMLLGGHFVLESAPGQGTRVNAKLPLRDFVERRVRERAL
ncbi:MAG: PAS domain S-box protein [Chloroflexi bacterium]|nr:PAS domain S-box protein [Chloroflexota bacterium]